MGVENAGGRVAPLAVVDDGAHAEGEPTVCGACGALLEPDDDYCPECGLELPAGHRLRRRRRVLVAGLVTALVAAIAAATTFGVLWRTEVSNGSQAGGELRAAQSQAARAQAAEKRLTRALAATRLRLAQVERLSAVRGGVLSQTTQAVKQVDPLLSSVDSLRRITGTIQTSRNRFADSVDEVVNSLITFSNAILEAQRNGDALDDAWTGEQVASINGSLDKLGAGYDALEGADTAYGKASRRFEARANDFNLVIRKLQAQLRAVVET